MIHRFTSFAILATFAAGSAMAGTVGTVGIPIGAGTNGVYGLTASYLTSSANPTLNTNSGFEERSYNVLLFGGATNGSTTLAPYGSANPSYSTGTYNVVGPSGETTSPTYAGTIVDPTSGVTFATVDDACLNGSSCNGTTRQSANTWVSIGDTTLTVPVGVYGVTDVWTLLNDVYGSPNAYNTTITFDFGNSAGATNGTSLVLQLQNSSSNLSSTGSGQIGTDVDCSVAGSTSCNGYSVGPVAHASSLSPYTGTTANATSDLSAAGMSSVNVYSNVIYTSQYTAATSSAFAGSTGTVNMYDQDFSLGAAFQGLYLVDIKVTEAAGSTDDLSLSAITVQTPEPAAFGLLFVGLIGTGFAVGRRRLA